MEQLFSSGDPVSAQTETTSLLLVPPAPSTMSRNPSTNNIIDNISSTNFVERKRSFDNMMTRVAAATTTATDEENVLEGSNTANNNDDDNNNISFVRKPVGKDGEPLSEKKLRRLEKNRLSARECRRRKREATENMERQINLLEGENLRLRLQLQIGDEAQQTIHQEQQKLTEGLDDLLKSGASESEIYAKIDEYKEKFADYGRDRRSAMEFHLRNIERLLMPTQTTSVVLATLQGGAVPIEAGAEGKTAAANMSAENNLTPAVTTPSTERNDPASNNSTKAVDPSSMSSDTSATFASELPTTLPTDNKALFKHLVKILKVTPEQAAALKDSRFVAQEMDEILKETLSVLAELRTRLVQCGEDLESEFNNVRTILTPSQSAKFLVWVSQNKACMHMLNELWSKVYPSSPKSDESDKNGVIPLVPSEESTP